MKMVKYILWMIVILKYVSQSIKTKCRNRYRKLDYNLISETLVIETIGVNNNSNMDFQTCSNLCLSMNTKCPHFAFDEKHCLIFGALSGEGDNLPLPNIEVFVRKGKTNLCFSMKHT